MSLYPVAALAQAATVDTTTLITAIVVLIGSIGGTYSLFVKRVMDAHFEHLQASNLRIAALENEQDDSVKEIATLQVQLAQAKKEAQERKREYDRRIQELQDLAANQKREYDQRIAQLELSVQNKAAENSALQSQIDGLTTKLTDLSVQYESVTEERNSLQVAFEAANDARTRFRTELEDSRGMIADMRRQIKQLQDRAGIVEANGDDDEPPPTEPNAALPPAPPKTADADAGVESAVKPEDTQKNGGSVLPKAS